MSAAFSASNATFKIKSLSETENPAGNRRVFAPWKVLLNRYTNGEEWIIAAETDAEALASDGYELDGPLGYAYADAPK